MLASRFTHPQTVSPSSSWERPNTLLIVSCLTSEESLQFHTSASNVSAGTYGIPASAPFQYSYNSFSPNCSSLEQYKTNRSGSFSVPKPICWDMCDYSSPQPPFSQDVHDVHPDLGSLEGWKNWQRKCKLLTCTWTWESIIVVTRRIEIFRRKVQICSLL